MTAFVMRWATHSPLTPVIESTRTVERGLPHVMTFFSQNGPPAARGARPSQRGCFSGGTRRLSLSASARPVLSVRAVEQGESRPVLLRQILLGVKPEVRRPARPHVASPGAMIALPDVVHGPPHVGHDVTHRSRAISAAGLRHVHADGLDIGLPHVQADRA